MAIQTEITLEVNKIYNGDCLGVLKGCEDDFFDSCVTDPPYGISFMNKHWDYKVPSVEIWKEVFRVLKPGAHLLCACGTRTQHRMTVNIEDAGFEIRDVITWHYGSGFPKSLDISKAIDKAAGSEREVIGLTNRHTSRVDNSNGNAMNRFVSVDWDKESGKMNMTAPSTEEAKTWEGWGTALKPATEFWTLARKPVSENTVAANVLKYGTGALNIDGSRISLDGEQAPSGSAKRVYKSNEFTEEKIYGDNQETSPLGRFPANVIFDEFTGKILDKQTGELTSGHMDSVSQGKNYGIYGKYNGKEVYAEGDSGGASRFFYCAKADNYERNKGLKDFELMPLAASNQAKAELKRGNESFKANDEKESSWSSVQMRKNNHPTVKPIDLMRYLVKLITRKHGVCLDPFCGSGTTLIGCKLELINYVGIDLKEEYCKIAEGRVAAWNPPKYIEQTLF